MAIAFEMPLLCAPAQFHALHHFPSVMSRLQITLQQADCLTRKASPPIAKGEIRQGKRTSVLHENNM